MSESPVSLLIGESGIVHVDQRSASRGWTGTLHLQSCSMVCDKYHELNVCRLQSVSINARPFGDQKTVDTTFCEFAVFFSLTALKWHAFLGGIQTKPTFILLKTPSQLWRLPQKRCCKLSPANSTLVLARPPGGA
jgi:hypothetical protein